METAEQINVKSETEKKTTNTVSEEALANISSTHKYCTECGFKMSRKAVSCPACGFAQYSNVRNRIVAALFAFFLGAMGMHKFYLGKPYLGISLCILTIFLGLLIDVSFVFIVVMIGFIEGAWLLNMSDEEFFIKYVEIKK